MNVLSIMFSMTSVSVEMWCADLKCLIKINLPLLLTCFGFVLFLEPGRHIHGKDRFVS